MKNLDVTLSKDKKSVTIVMPIDMTKNAPESQTGKSIKRASTGGNQAVALDGKQVKIGVNIFETK